MKSDALVPSIRWGSYQSTEGPFFPGILRYHPPSEPSFLERSLAVVTATEGGCLDAVNGYDRCIISVGLIQHCEVSPQFSVSGLLGHCADGDRRLLLDYLSEISPKVDFKKNMHGAYRFCLDGREVQSPDDQRELFYGRSTVGPRGSWDDETRDHAKRAAAVLATLWQEDTFQKAQIAYTTPRLLSYCMPAAQKALFQPLIPTGFEGAMRAAYLSFTANNPLMADKQRALVMDRSEWSSLSAEERCLSMLKQLTFGPNIGIYPGRYDKIRPVLEFHFGVDLPDFSKELADWQTSSGQTPTPAPYDLTTTYGLQTALLALGYDLGPSGADGAIGKLTKAAILRFQLEHDLNADGLVGPKTRQALLDALAALPPPTASP
jgi:peptidoglycan hydrolase-like protein with peptidoglycan-binding domain